MTVPDETPAGQNQFDPFRATVPVEQLRFAVVLNGGISLAVWMGGASHELNRLTRAEGAYGTLLGLARTTAKCDVIAGTSAGGINGAALAIAQVNRKADLSIMRRLWAEQGRLESLLRTPFQGHPSSLLKGDEYFLPELNRAMHALASQPEIELDNVVDLTITTTILNPASVVTVDALGQNVYQQVHEGQFHFSGNTRSDADAARFLDRVRGRAPTDGDSPAARLLRDDPFSKANLNDTASALAFAARCSAGFPVAFEPTFVPAAGSSARPLKNGASLRPDMGQWASWREADSSASPRDSSRYAIDGGVLANTPTKAALAGIGRMGTEGPVRRIMLMVHPHAAAEQDLPADSVESPPTLTREISGLLGALASQGNRSFVEQIEDHNRSATSGRGGRTDILKSLTSIDDLYDLVDSTVWWNQYRTLRIRRAARDLAARPQAMTNWSYERKRQAVLETHEYWVREYGELPYLPEDSYTESPPGDASPSYTGASTPTHSSWLDAAKGGPVLNQYDEECPLRGWNWGITTALGIADSVSELIRRAQATAPESLAEPLAASMLEVSGARAALYASRDLTNDPWLKRPWSELDPDMGYWSLRLEAYSLAMLGAPLDDVGRSRTQTPPSPATKTAAEIRDSVLDRAGIDLETQTDVERNTSFCGLMLISRQQGRTDIPQRWAGDAVAFQVWRAIKALSQVVDIVRRLTGLDSLSKGETRQSKLGREVLLDQAVHSREDPLSGMPPSAVQHEMLLPDRLIWRYRMCLLTRLLTLEISTWLISDDRSVGGTEQPITLVQLSAQVSNFFTGNQLPTADKLAGQALSRFGGFLKRSWRMNDWVWGRLDAATLLCQVVLQPDRMRRLGEVAGYTEPGLAAPSAAAMVNQFVKELYGREEMPELLGAVMRAAEQELSNLWVSDPVGVSSRPLALPNLANLAAYALHAKIIADELPVLAASIASDAVEGSNSRSHGEIFLVKHAAAIRQLERADSNSTGWLTRGKRGLDAFSDSGIGREPLREEVSSDQMIRTTATSVAVAVTMLDSERSGLGAAKPVTRVAKGLTLIPYWILTGLSKGSATARYLSLFALAIGALLLVLSLLDALPGWAASAGSALGVASLLAALGFAALRSGTFLHGIAMLGLVVPALVLAVQRAVESMKNQPGGNDTAHSAAIGISTIVVTALVVAGLVVLGSIPNPMHTPSATISDAVEMKTRRFLIREIGPKATQSLWMSSTCDRWRLAFNRGRRESRPKTPNSFPWEYLTTTIVRTVSRIAAWTLSLTVGTVVVFRFFGAGADGLAILNAIEDWSFLAVWVLAGCIALCVLGLRIAQINGRSLRVYQDVRTDSVTAGLSSKWSADHPRITLIDSNRLSLPAAVAATWSVVYGAVFSLVAFGTAIFLVNSDEDWAGAILLNAVVFVVLLTVVIPTVAPRRYRKRITDELASDPFLIRSLGESDASPDKLLVDLARRGSAYAFLVWPKKDPYQLSKVGRDLYLRLRGRAFVANKGAALPRGGVPLSIHILALSVGAALLLWGVPGEQFLAAVPHAVFWVLVVLILAGSVIEGLNLVRFATGLWRGALAATAVSVGVVLLVALSSSATYPPTRALANSLIPQGAVPWAVLIVTSGSVALLAYGVSSLFAPDKVDAERDAPE